MGICIPMVRLPVMTSPTLTHATNRGALLANYSALFTGCLLADLATFLLVETVTNTLVPTTAVVLLTVRNTLVAVECLGTLRAQQRCLLLSTATLLRKACALVVVTEALEVLAVLIAATTHWWTGATAQFKLFNAVQVRWFRTGVLHHGRPTSRGHTRGGITHDTKNSIG